MRLYGVFDSLWGHHREISRNFNGCGIFLAISRARGLPANLS